MSVPRGLSAEEQTAWARLAASVTPMPGKKVPGVSEGSRVSPVSALPASAPVGHGPKLSPQKSKPKQSDSTTPNPRNAQPIGSGNLDGSWNRKLKAGQISPDYTLDLHGHSLDGAYERIMSGIDQARAMGARVVLVIAGRARPVDPADRATKRGAIRAKLLDWLAASRHSESIAAIRRAHIRHGGEGALYLVLKRTR